MGFFVETLATHARSRAQGLSMTITGFGPSQSRRPTSQDDSQSTPKSTPDENTIAPDIQLPQPPNPALLTQESGRPALAPPEFVLTPDSEPSVPTAVQSSIPPSPTASTRGTTMVGEDSTASSVKDDDEVVVMSQADLDRMKVAVFAELDKLIGLEKVKEQFRDIEKRIDAYKNQGVKVERERFHIKFLGNPGTGKTTVARLYARFLFAMGIIQKATYVEKSGSLLAANGFESIIDMLQLGGVVFIDEAYQLTSQHHAGGKQALDIIQTIMENQLGHLVMIFAGYNKDMETFIGHNSGLDSRIPYTLQFEDFTPDELLTILKRKINEKYHGAMKIEAHPGDGEKESRYLRIATNRLGRGRGNRGFGNARSVENLLEKIARRQAHRLNRVPKAERDYLLFTREDIIGPDPATAKFQSQAWIKLQGMIGISTFKASVEAIIGMCEMNYQRELLVLEPETLSLNGLFLGAPGTGKTTVAKLYGRILADLGMLSNGEVVLKNPSDFIGESLGSSEAKTRAILSATIGKVLIIDEAYGLCSGSGQNSGSTTTQDSYRTGVIDALVGEVQGNAGEDRCILLLGYTEQIKEMFQKVNPGLKRRFAFDSPFMFENFSLDQLMDILKQKLQDQDLEASDEALAIARQVLERASTHPDFSNAGAVDSCLQEAKKRRQIRLQSTPISGRDFADQLQAVDFDPDHGLKTQGYTDCQALLQGVVSKDVIDQIDQFQQQALMAKLSGSMNFRDVIPTNYIFIGGPGTGKTTAARKMGTIYYNLGYLSSDEVVECSAVDLIGEFVGQTRPKTRAKLDMAVGKVILIDDAFQLLKGPYSLEALQELITCLASAKYAHKMVVILAGYTEEMQYLVKACGPLASLFPNEVFFKDMKVKDCIRLLERELGEINVAAPFLQEEGSDQYKKLHKLLKALSLGPSWGNARDIQSLAKSMKSKVFKEYFKTNRELVLRSQAHSQADASTLTLPPLSVDQAISCVKEMIKQRRRCMTSKAVSFDPEPEFADDDPRFARAFAHGHVPVMSIQIHLHEARPELPHSHRSALDELTGFDDRPRGRPMHATITLTTSTFAGFDHHMPARFGHSMLGGFDGPMHTSDELIFQKPSAAYVQAYREIEEIIDEEEESGDPNKAGSTQDPSAPPVVETTVLDGLAKNSSEKAQIQSSNQSAVGLGAGVGSKAQVENIKAVTSTSNKTKTRRKFGDIVTEQTQRALKDMGVCPQGFAWTRSWITKSYGRHICEGGCHWAYDGALNDFMDSHGYD